MITLPRLASTPLPRSGRRALLAGAAAVLALAVASGSTFVVQPTEMAGVRRFGTVLSGAPIGPGLHFKAPLIDTVDRMQISLDTFQVSDLPVYTVDNQAVHVGIAMSYRVPPVAVMHLLYEVGRAGNAGIVENIRPVLADRALRVFAGRNTLSISAEREAIAAAIRREVQASLGAMFGLEVVDLQISSLAYSPAFVTSVEAAVRSKNEALAAENLVARTRYEGEQRKVQAEVDAAAGISRARGERQAAILRAEGEAQAAVLRGEAEARVIGLRAAAVGSNPALVAYMQAERWNGQLPATVLGSAALPVLDLNGRR